jgi:hypothetical protein
MGNEKNKDLVMMAMAAVVHRKGPFSSRASVPKPAVDSEKSIRFHFIFSN